MKKSIWEISLGAFYYPDHDKNLVYIERIWYPNNLPFFTETLLIDKNDLSNYITANKTKKR